MQKELAEMQSNLAETQSNLADQEIMSKLCEQYQFTQEQVKEYL